MADDSTLSAANEGASANVFKENRRRFFERMSEGSVLFMFAGSPPRERGDAFYPFSPQRNFYYLTGISEPRIILAMEKRPAPAAPVTTLFVERGSPISAKWVGEVLSKDAARSISGADAVGYTDEFDDFSSRVLFALSTRAPRRPDVYLDLENRSLSEPPSHDLRFARLVRDGFPSVRLVDAYPILSSMRMIKLPWEVALIRRSAECAAEALAFTMANVKPGMPEHEAEAYFDFVLKKNDMGRAFASIVASGANAAVLHYERNDAVMRDGDLLLMDVGAACGNYRSDVSRTFPVNGRFTARQRELYEIVLEANTRTIAAVEPGRPFFELNKTVTDFYEKALPKVGLDVADGVSRYYYHSVSHPLGLETHDVGAGAFDKLEPGMVLTVEPGLYIADEGIGIRVEDDVLVTDDGSETLTASIPKTADAIEAAMAARGFLWTKNA